MKKTIATLLLLCLLLTGCSMQHEQDASPDAIIEQNETPAPQPDKTPNEGPEKTEQTDTPAGTTTPPPQSPQKEPPAGAFDPNYEGPIDRRTRAVIYGDTAYYECDPYERNPWQPHIYALPLGEKTATDLLKGELIALAGSVLIGKTATHFCAMELAADAPKWVNLGPAATYLTHLQQGDTLYLYLTLGEKYFADVIDLKSFKVERMTAPSTLRQVTAVDDEIFYLTADGFYRGDPLKRSVVLLDTATDGEQLYVVDDFVITYQNGVLPRIYNCKTATLTTPENLKNKVGKTNGPFPTEDMDGGSRENPRYRKFLDGIVTVSTYTHLWGELIQTFCYDIINDRELTETDPRYRNYSKSFVANGGYLIENENTGQFEYYVNGKKYTAPKNQNGNYATIITENGAASLYQSAIYTVSFKTNQAATILHYEQAVTTE